MGMGFGRGMGRGGVGAPIVRLLANLIVMGTGVLGRAFLEAYKQALQGARLPPCVPASLPAMLTVPLLRAPARRWWGSECCKGRGPAGGHARG